MQDIPKRVKRTLRELAGCAHAAELAREFSALSVKFDEWKAGRITVWELREAIHRFDCDTARTLAGRYDERNVPPEISVAYALTAGLLDEDEVPEEAMPYLAQALGFYGYGARQARDGEGDELA